MYELSRLIAVTDVLYHQHFIVAVRYRKSHMIALIANLVEFLTEASSMLSVISMSCLFFMKG